MSFAIAAVLSGHPAIAHAQPLPASHAERPESLTVSCAGGGATTPGRDRWDPPLDRRVTLSGRDLSLRVALDRVAAGAKVRLSYASDLLPLDRTVCPDFRDVALGDALASLLTGVNVEPVSAGDDQVVLAPAARPMMARSIARVEMLERVVVTGSASGTSARRLTVGLDVIEGKEVAARGGSTLAEILDGVVPGLWVWEQSPASLVARYGSIRGASSFGLSYPKIYIDGIEVASPILLTRVVPEGIERIEVIRGPQGAALYGADAISGVINIVTRHEGAGLDGGTDARDFRVRSSAGVAGSDYATGENAVFAQDHAFDLRAGSSARAAGLTLAYGSVGPFIPDGDARHLSANGYLRLVGSNRSLVATARLFTQRAGAGESPLLPVPATPTPPATRPAMHRTGAGGVADSTAAPVTLGDAPQSVRQYTLGATGSATNGGRWTHTAVLGLDGYRLEDVAFAGGPVVSASDSALRAARGGADRGMLRVSSVAHLGVDSLTSTVLTLAAEQTLLREETAPRAPDPMDGGPGPGPGGGGGGDDVRSFEDAVAWRNTTGLSAQANVGFRNALFVTGGLRLERNAGYGDSPGVDALPMLGASWVRALGGGTLKLRASYGKGIRPPRTEGASATWSLRQRAQLTASSLEPEVQAGIEGGADFLVGDRFGFHVTRFDQKATGLIQAVAIAPDWGQDRPTSRGGLIYELQNVGEITNRGWELQGTWREGRFGLQGALSLVESRVAQVTDGYTGDLRAGDRMLEVPERTASLVATWLGAKWSTAWTLSRASDWVGYDRIAIANDAVSSLRRPGDFAGDRLRAYWIEYDGETRLRARITREMGRGLRLTLTGDNLLGEQVGEPDNATVLPGRSLLLGVGARF